MTNKHIFIKYLNLRKYVIFISLIVLIVTSIFRLGIELNYGLRLLHNLAIFLILFALLFEAIEVPFFINILNDKEGMIIETFFPNFKKNVVFKKQNIKALRVSNNHKLHITKHKSNLSLKIYIKLSITDDNGDQIVMKSFNTRWLDPDGLEQINDIVECHNFANHNFDSDKA
ncbi:hypothetical protein N9E56_01115 [Flavobacteriaceae bacterium]|nr:hypothetical protein [Flavobacteriaceae bacterium]